MFHTGHPIPRTVALIKNGMTDGLHVGAQLYVSQNGVDLAELCAGLARPGVPMTPDSMMIWFSSTKPIVAVAIAQLWERGKLALDDRIAQHIPEFAQRDKQDITVRHILTHTGGFRGLISGQTADPWDKMLAQVYALRLERDWVPGEKAGYHPISSWFILGELVRRLDGRPLEQYVREEIFFPLGMTDCWIGIPAEQYIAYGDRIGLMHRTENRAEPAASTAADAIEVATQCRPGSGGRGPMRQLARFYEAMLGHGELDGRRIISPQTVEAMTAVHRVGMYDHTFKHVMDWGLGFLINSEQYGDHDMPYSFGPYASRRTYGHGGVQSSVAFADPVRGLAVALVFNGTPGETAHDQRVRSVLAAIYEDLDEVK